MLPFLKPKRQDAGIAVTVRTPDGGMEREEDHSEGLKACAADLIRAVHAKDEDSVASAIKAAFEILDSLPHNEGPHTNDEDSE